MVNCFKCGIYWQGLTHDLSKYSPTEFFPGAKYYEGFRSPTIQERIDKGYSVAWMHHKGRNRHHYEYWIDINPQTKKYEPVEMPTKYLIEMFCDRMAASKVYLKDKYTDSSPLSYLLEREKDAKMNPITEQKITYLLTYLSENGEKKTFSLIRKNRKKKDFLNDIIKVK